MGEPSNQPKDWWPTLIGLASVAFVAIPGFVWLGGVSARVEVIENKIEALASGPRGRSCEHIVERLVAAIERRNEAQQEQLQRLADQWGCSMIPLMGPAPGNQQQAVEP